MCKIKNIKIGAVLLALSVCCSVDIGYGSSFQGTLNGTRDITLNSDINLYGNSDTTYNGNVTVNGTRIGFSYPGSIAGGRINLIDTGGFFIYDSMDRDAHTVSIASLSCSTSSNPIFIGNSTLKTLNLANASDTCSGVISGNGSINISNGTETFDNTMTYTGNTAIAEGATLILKGSISDSGVIANGTLNVSGFGNCSILSLSGGANGVVILTGGTLVLTNASGGAYDGNIDGHANLTIAGGTENLSGGYYNYSGTTTINNGSTLVLSGNGSISNSSSVNVNGTFDISSNTNGTVCISGLNGTNSNATINFGAVNLTIGPSCIQL